MAGPLAEPVALVTGASSGIGAAAAVGLGSVGAANCRAVIGQELRRHNIRVCIMVPQRANVSPLLVRPTTDTAAM